MSTKSNDGNLVPDSNIKYASFQHRLGAEALDTALMLVTLWIGWVIWSLIVWGEGQTPAKKILKIRVLSAQNNKPATWGHMAVRQLLIPLTLFIASLNVDNPKFMLICGVSGAVGKFITNFFTDGKQI